MAFARDCWKTGLPVQFWCSPIIFINRHKVPAVAYSWGVAGSVDLITRVSSLDTGE
jgi:hypothetical protein